jgi:hypothetical protein
MACKIGVAGVERGYVVVTVFEEAVVLPLEVVSVEAADACTRALGVIVGNYGGIKGVIGERTVLRRREAARRVCKDAVGELLGRMLVGSFMARDGCSCTISGRTCSVCIEAAIGVDVMRLIVTNSVFYYGEEHWYAGVTLAAVDAEGCFIQS